MKKLTVDLGHHYPLVSICLLMGIPSLMLEFNYALGSKLIYISLVISTRAYSYSWTKRNCRWIIIYGQEYMCFGWYSIYWNL